MTGARISVGDTVRVTGGKNQGLQATVLTIYRANALYDRRAFVEMQLTDGPYRTTLALRLLEKVAS